MTITELPAPYAGAANAELDPGNLADLLTELGRIYLNAGLPLAAAFEAALADYASFGFTGAPCP